MKKLMIAIVALVLAGCAALQNVPEASMYMNAEKQNVGDACMHEAAQNARDLKWVASCKKGQGVYESAKRTCAAMYGTSNPAALQACINTTYSSLTLQVK